MVWGCLWWPFCEERVFSRTLRRQKHATDDQKCELRPEYVATADGEPGEVDGDRVVRRHDQP